MARDGFLILLVGDLKQRHPDERRQILSNYDAFIGWIDQVPQEGRRQFRHMLRFFCFPDRVERMSSNRERRAVIAGFGVAPEKESRTWSDQQLDDALLRLREKLQAEYPNEKLDFYDSPLRERWMPSNRLEREEKIVTNRRFWVEKTLVKNRPDRQSGDNAVGKALWSPQLAKGERNLYRSMREVQAGDVVFHIVDNETVDSFSIAAAAPLKREPPRETK
jgi:5-methylcytosine-specific restriction protein B